MLVITCNIKAMLVSHDLNFCTPFVGQAGVSFMWLYCTATDLQSTALLS